VRNRHLAANGSHVHNATAAALLHLGKYFERGVQLPQKWVFISFS
jgi:hypothetical protein